MKNQPLTILELGCGTGKFTRVLMEVLKNTDARVIASDPLDTMLEEFRKILPNVEVKQITAEEIAFPDSSIDVVLAAHCFHWFANEEAVREIYRVLAPGGTLGIIWALPDESVPWLKEMMTFFRPLEEDFKYTISKETMDKVFEEVGKLFTVEKESGMKTSWYLSYDGCYKYFVSKGIIQRGTNEVKRQLKTWFDYVIGKHFPTSEEKESITFPLAYLICWCKKKQF